MASNGFALAEYSVPKAGHLRAIQGGTMPKASADVGSMLSEVKRISKNPGPEAYNQNCLTKSFAGHARGGTFSKLQREYGNSVKTPAVGQYQTVCPQTSPRTRGGSLPKTDRGCIFYDRAVNEGKWKQSPGKYDGKRLEMHKTCPAFQSGSTESRNPKKAVQVGPGYYSLEYKQVEPKVPCYSSPHDNGQSYLEQATKGKDKLPAPGHNGVAEAKNQDRQGKRRHAARILADRIITPRYQQVEA